jgi:transketolase
MLNRELKLNPNIFEEGIEKEATRVGFGKGLVQAGEEDLNVVALSADLTESTKADSFAKKFPDRFFEVGIAEQNLASVASGLAHLGKIPFATSYAMFSPGRNWEQIRTTIAYNNQPVIIVGSHAGLVTGPDGGTHQALEDIAITRVIPNMIVISPCDSVQAYKATTALAKNPKPAYLRLSRENTPVITTEETDFEIGKAQILFETKNNPDVAIFVTGILTYTALLAAHELSESGINVVVVNIHTIKPLDSDLILEVVKKAGSVVTVEEHQKFGGLGSAISELLSEKYPVPIEFVAVNDKFGQSGNSKELLEEYGLTQNEIEKAVEKVVDRKTT